MSDITEGLYTLNGTLYKVSKSRYPRVRWVCTEVDKDSDWSGRTHDLSDETWKAMEPAAAWLSL